MARKGLREKWNLDLSTETGIEILPGDWSGKSPAWIMFRRQGRTRQLQKVLKEAPSEGAAVQAPEVSVANPYIRYTLFLS